MSAPRTITFEERAKDILTKLETLPASRDVTHLKNDITQLQAIIANITQGWSANQRAVLDRVELLQNFYQIKSNILNVLPNSIEKDLKNFQKNLTDYIIFIQQKFLKRDEKFADEKSLYDIDAFLKEMRQPISYDLRYTLARSGEPDEMQEEDNAMKTLHSLASSIDAVNKQVQTKKVLDGSLKQVEAKTIDLTNHFVKIQNVQDNKDLLAEVILMVQNYRRELAETLKISKVEILKFDIGEKISAQELSPPRHSLTPPSSSLGDLLKIHGKFSSPSTLVSPNSPRSPSPSVDMSVSEKFDLSDSRARTLSEEFEKEDEVEQKNNTPSPSFGFKRK